MKEKLNIRKKIECDNNVIMQILNSFVGDSFAAYPNELVGSSFVVDCTRDAKVFLVVEINNEVIGFGMITPYKKYSNFNHTGVLGYFIKEKLTGAGLGSKLLQELISQGKQIGITNYLAHISSYNEQSLSFHKKHGFEEVGRFKNISSKFGKSIDIVWVQKDYGHLKNDE